jgi:hypothetical protein
VEVDYGYSPARILESIRRKYSKPLPFFEDITKLILVVGSSVGLVTFRDVCAQVPTKHGCMGSVPREPCLRVY